MNNLKYCLNSFLNDHGLKKKKVVKIIRIILNDKGLILWSFRKSRTFISQHDNLINPIGYPILPID